MSAYRSSTLTPRCSGPGTHSRGWRTCSYPPGPAAQRSSSRHTGNGAEGGGAACLPGCGWVLAGCLADGRGGGGWLAGWLAGCWVGGGEQLTTAAAWVGGGWLAGWLLGGWVGGCGGGRLEEHSADMWDAGQNMEVGLWGDQPTGYYVHIFCIDIPYMIYNIFIYGIDNYI